MRINRLRLVPVQRLYVDRSPRDESNQAKQQRVAATSLSGFEMENFGSPE